MANHCNILYVYADSGFGRMLIAATETGLVWASFGGSDEQMLADLLVAFPLAKPGNGERLARWSAALVRYLAGENSGIDLPVDLLGTPFQNEVWETLRKIPRGQTITYTQLAERIGKPDAVRAAAHACACNRVAVLIPCHRVLRSDGTLGGYRWGLDRKRALLDWEAQIESGFL